MASGKRGLTWPRLLVISFVVALVAVLGGGAGGYLVVHNIKKGGDRADCGVTNCIPGMKGEAVLAALRARGYTCAEDVNWRCNLRTGETEYGLYLDVRSELIHEYTASVSSPEGREVTETKMAYLTWFAALPFSDDPALVGEIEQWLIPRLTGGENVTANIGGYRYELEAERTRILRLRVQAAYS